LTEETGQDLATTTPTGLTAADEDAIAREALSAMEGERVQLPMLKVTQQTSKEVTNDNLDRGVFVNTLTGADYGNAVGLVIADTAKGRFYSDDDNTFVAQGTDIVPNNWPEQWVGQRFDELPEAEETYKARANAGDIEWGKGPAIRTTYNYIGFIADDPDVPVRLSLQRTSKPAADKINTILRFALKSPWSNVIDLATAEKRDSQDRPYWVVRASQGRKTTDEERQQAVTLFQQIRSQGAELTGEENEGKARREAASSPDDLDIT